MTIHAEPSPLAGKTVKLKGIAGFDEGTEYRVEDWWDRVFGKSWMFADGNPAALNYAMASGFSTPPTPTDNEVLYGKVGGLGFLVHISWLSGAEGGAS